MVFVNSVFNRLFQWPLATVALLVFSDNESGNTFWENHGFTKRSDITYRNKVISDAEMVRNREEK